MLNTQIEVNSSYEEMSQRPVNCTHANILASEVFPLYKT